jgi:hypothetical protein
MDPFKAKVHPAADLYPMLEGEAYKELKDSIHKNGCRNPVVLTNNGKVLADGRNRVKICRELRIEPDIVLLPEEYDDQDILDYIVDQNSKRRQLTPSQLAAVGADMLPMYAAAAKERQGKRTDLTSASTEAEVQNGASPSTEGEAKSQGRANRQVAEKLGVGHASIAKATKVKKNNKKLFKQVKDGKISVNKASELVDAEEKAKHVPKRTPEQEIALRFKGYKTRYNNMEKELHELCKLFPKLKETKGDQFYRVAASKLKHYSNTLEKLGEAS